MQLRYANRLIAWRATLTDTAARLRRPKVTAILCQHCEQWVKPRRYDPTVYACTRCAPQAARNYYRAKRIAAAAAEAQQRRALDEQLRQWRRKPDAAQAQARAQVNSAA